jgi:hypothetical protein
MESKKAQIWSYDLIISSILFLIALGILAFFWWSVTTTVSKSEEKIITESLKFSDMLLTPGIPEIWFVNSSMAGTWDNVQQIGLTTNTSKRIVEWMKLGSFYEMSNYDYPRTRLKAKSHYDYYIYLTKHNGTEQAVGVVGYGLPVTYYSAGLNPASYDARTIVKTERIVIYQNETVRFKLLTWTSQLWD